MNLKSWKIVFSCGREILPEQMLHLEEREENGIRKYLWTGHPEGGPSFSVRVEWMPLEDDLFSGTISFEGYQGERICSEIHFPVISFPISGKSRLAAGTWDTGVWRDFPEKSISSPASTTPETGRKTFFRESYRSLQFSAVPSTDGLPGWYFDHRDSRWGEKALELSRSSDGSLGIYSGIHPVPAPHDSVLRSYSVPYANTAGPFEGSWFEAAQIYRKWSETQVWSLRTPKENPLRKIGIWVWNRGRSEDVIPPVLRLAEESGVPVALDWYWWHRNPYDTDYPDFWPPREGVEKFSASIKQLHEKGIFVQTYINGVCWDHDGASWRNGGSQGVVVKPDGSLQEHMFNKYNRHRLAFMCGEAPVFHDRLSSLVGRLRACGLDGQYLDMIGGCAWSLCRNPDHKHRRNDPYSGVDGYRKLLTRLRAENPDFPLSTEYANEAFMDLISGAIICGAMSPEHMGMALDTLPLFQAVHHGKMVLFGNYAFPDGIPPWDPLWPSEDRWKTEQNWNALYPDQFFIETARPVIAGAQPMVCKLKMNVFEDPSFRSVHDFLLETISFYHANRDFLLDGVMGSPAGFECARKEVSFFPRMIFTKEHECKALKRVLPCVLHSVWSNAAGERALFLANYTEKEQSWRFHSHRGVLSPRSYERFIF